MYPITKNQYRYLLPTPSKKYLFARDDKYFIIADREEYKYIMSKFEGLSPADLDNTHLHFPS